ncbi:MAG TPA: hypothetical protein ENJ89_05110 [Caldithrix abyssi]|uniref:Uncharacterized protein n=1 Tax=Caldithrix abyssi TaxID=187145 RepID=A0A7V5PP74_CALAY|nr:hypothetical protein [Caldithrix abyssi]
MNFKQFLGSAALTFLVTLVTALVVTFLWNFFVHNAGRVDWETSFILAIIYGVVFPLSRSLEKK